MEAARIIADRSGPGIECRIAIVLVALCLCACSEPASESVEAEAFEPRFVVDLGALVTEDLPEQVWGTRFLEEMGFTEPNSFRVLPWTFPMDGAEVSGSNAYYTCLCTKRPGVP